MISLLPLPSCVASLRLRCCLARHLFHVTRAKHRGCPLAPRPAAATPKDRRPLPFALPDTFVTGAQAAAARRRMRCRVSRPTHRFTQRARNVYAPSRNVISPSFSAKTRRRARVTATVHASGDTPWLRTLPPRRSSRLSSVLMTPFSRTCRSGGYPYFCSTACAPSVPLVTRGSAI